MKSWYRFSAKADDAVVDIHIVDFIGDWVDDWFNRNFGYDLALTAKAFIDELSKLPENVTTIRVHINSPGGDVFGALNIANALRDQQVSKGRTVETIVDGLAASAASIVMMAGSKVTMADNALVMVHNPWFVAVGDAAEMRKAADELDKVRTTIVATYKWHSALDDADLVALMDAETWMDADEAIAKGFATDKAQGLKAAASITPKGLAQLHVPEKYKARVDALVKRDDPPADPPKASAAEILALCERAGLDLAFANSLLAANLSLADATQRVDAEKRRRADASARETQIGALCAKAGQTSRAPLYVKSSLSLDDIKADLANLKAQFDRVEIDGGLPPDREASRATHALNPAEIYAARNRQLIDKESKHGAQ